MRRLTCLGCGLVFRFRSLERLARRVAVHRCWEAAS